MNMLKNKSGIAPAFMAVIVWPLLVLILVIPIFIFGYTILWKVVSFVNAPVTGNIPVWAFALGIIAIAIIFKRREKAFMPQQ